jgi:plastocyanin
MKRFTKWAILATVALMIVVSTAGCTSTTSPSVTSTPTPTAAKSASVQNVEIIIGTYGIIYNGADITVKQGASVTWKNFDSNPHKIVSQNGQFDSSNMTSLAGRFTHQFNNKGTFLYAIDESGPYNLWHRIIVE